MSSNDDHVVLLIHSRLIQSFETSVVSNLHTITVQRYYGTVTRMPLNHHNGGDQMCELFDLQEAWGCSEQNSVVSVTSSDIALLNVRGQTGIHIKIDVPSIATSSMYKCRNQRRRQMLWMR